MKIDWKKLIVAVAIPLAVGGLASLLTAEAYADFGKLQQPQLSPPAWLFPVVWTILYFLMGVASYIIWTSVTTYEKRKHALFIYGMQLFFNFMWSIIFFNLKEYYFAFVWLTALWLLIYLTYTHFKRIDGLAAKLLIPYLVWVAFAGYLNLGVAILN